MPTSNPRGNYLGTTAYGFLTKDLKDLELGGIEVVETQGFYAEGDGGDGRWFRTGSTGTANTNDFANGRIYDLTSGDEFELAGPSFHVKQFGAKGDGATDDITAIQNAIDHSGGRCVFPSGTYVISSAITLAGSGFVINGVGGAGSKIVLQAASNDDMIKLASANDVVITDIELDGNRANQSSTSYAILIDGTSQDTRIHDIKITNPYTDGIRAATGGNGLWVTNVRIDAPGSSGVNIALGVAVTKASFLTNVIVFDHNALATASPVPAFNLSGICHVVNCQSNQTGAVQSAGFEYSSHATTASTGAHGSTIDGCTVIGDATTASTYGVRMLARNCALSNGYIEGCDYGVYVDPLVGIDDGAISNVVVKGGVAASGASFSLQSASSATGLMNCTSIDAPLIAYEVDGADQSHFFSCTARGAVADGWLVKTGSNQTVLRDCLAATCLRGIKIDSGATDCRVTGQLYDTNTTDWTDGTTNEVVRELNKRRTVASATTIAITPEDSELAITGSTAVDFMTGGTDGQIIVLMWDVGATWSLTHESGTPTVGTGYFSIASTKSGHTSGDTVTVVARYTSGTHPDWFAIGHEDN